MGLAYQRTWVLEGEDMWPFAWRTGPSAREGLT